MNGAVIPLWTAAPHVVDVASLELAAVSTVAGIAVSPDHYIGGRRVPSDERFEDRSPIDESRARRGRARRRGRGRHWPSRRPRDAFPAWAALGPGRRAASTCAGSPT